MYLQMTLSSLTANKNSDLWWSLTITWCEMPVYQVDQWRENQFP